MKITCRICRIQQGEFFTLDSIVPINGQREYKLLDIFNKCFQLSAQLQDGLPQVVCLLCLEKQKEFFEFQLKAEKSDLEFREILQECQIQNVNTEYMKNFNITTNTAKTNIPINTKLEMEEEVITTEDECEDDDDEDNSEGDVRSPEDDDDDDEEEEVEDTDILFELYSKNDSCLEKYLKNDNEQEDLAENVYATNDKEELKNEIDIDETLTDIMNNTPMESNIITIDNPKCHEIENPLSNLEISRIQTPVQYSHVQTLILEPLVEVRKWQCNDCGRKYLTEEKLETHRKLHNQSEDCQCEICGSHLKTLYEYREHMKAHGTERKFSCEFCDKTFTTRANLKAHLYIHTNLRPFKCEICGKTFQQKSILKTHMTLHTGKPFECTLCQRRFSRTAHLNIHMRQHNNIRPYQCPQCPSSYMQKSHLDRHISSSHLGIRFQCTICGKMYTKKPSLNTHMRDAHCKTVSLYNCEICDLDFAKQKGLYYHMKSKHPDYKKNQN